MRSRKNVILLWVMLLCVAFATAGCGKDKKEKDVLADLELTDIAESSDEKTADSEGSGALDGSGEAQEDAKAADETGVIYVDVCGQVKNPGVYQLTGESRVYEAIEKAGGMTQDAAAASVNQAERLADGQQIYIPSEDEQKEGRDSNTASASGNAQSGSANNGKINLNTASKEELMTLSGIGEVKADSIIRYREEHGGFRSVEDVKKIEGIKDGVFNKIKDQITI